MPTTSEFLDENEPDLHYRGLVIGLTAITFCPPCGHVDEEMITRVNQPCGTCELICPRRQLLSSIPEDRLLSMLFDCYKREDSRPLCVLLFCALTEEHLHYFAMRRRQLMGKGTRLHAARRLRLCRVDAGHENDGFPIYRAYRQREPFHVGAFFSLATVLAG